MDTFKSNRKKFIDTMTNRYKTNTKLIYLSIILIIVIGIVGYSTFRINKYNKRLNAIPTVAGANFDWNYKKIPYNVKYIDFTFSTKLDPTSVNTNTFKIIPEVVGQVNLISGNTIRYILSNNLEKNKDYYISISKEIKGDNGKNLEKDYTYMVETIGAVKTNKILPEGDIDNLNQTISVYFNIPLVPLTNLAKHDDLPCPIEITPNIEGKCKWTTTSVLEFSPKDHLQGATKYTIKVVDKPGLFYPISTGYQSIIQTSKLQAFLNESFNPKEGIVLTFNHPIKQDDLTANLKIGEYLSGKTTNIDLNIENKDNSSQTFVINPKNGKFIYSKSYKVDIKSGINPLYGNTPMEGDFSKEILANDFLSNTIVYKNIYSNTGLFLSKEYINIIDKPNQDHSNEYEYSYLPNNPEFNLEFLEEVPLDKSLINISYNDGGTIDYSLSYQKDSIEKIEKGKKIKEELENKKIIIIKINKKLENNKTLQFKISKSVNNSLEKDIINEYKTSPVFKLVETKFLNYNKTCLYFNNPISKENKLDYLSPKNKDFKNISISPNARIASFNTEITRFDDFIDQINEIRNDVSWDNFSTDQQKQMDKLFLDNGACPIFLHKDATAYALNTRLNPNSKYTIDITDNIFDKYGNKLSNPEKIDIQTKELAEKDKYLYSSLNKDINVVPSNIPLTLNLQSMNIDNAFVQICEMDNEGYKDYVSNVYYGYNQEYQPKCIKTTNKNLKLINKNWELSNNRFDMEKDIIGGNFVGKYLLVRGAVGNGYDPKILNEMKSYNGTSYFDKFYKNSSINKEFSNLYIRTDLFLGLEKAKNKNLLFATDIYGKQEINNLKFEVYKYNSESKILESTKINPTYNSNTKVYEFPDDNYSLIIAYNDKNYGSLLLDNDSLPNYDFGYIAGNGSSEKEYLYLYTDRPLYKPGDTVYFKGLVRKFTFDGFHKSDKKTGLLSITNEEGTQLVSLDIKIDKNSNFSGEFIIPSDAPTGNFSFDFTAENQEDSIPNNAGFSIEEYVKPVFKIETTSSKNEYLLGEKISIDVQPQYYFGGKMINTKGNVGILSQNYYFDAKDYSDYQFGDGYEYFNCLYWDSCSYNDNLLEYTGFSIDTSGNYSFDYDLNATGINGEQILTFNFEITDPDTQKTVNKDYPIVIHKTDGYVGIQNNYWNNKNEGIKTKGILLDTNANPKKGKILLKLYKLDRQTAKKQDVDGIFYNDANINETLVKEIDAYSNDKGVFEKEFKPENDGEYKIVAIYTGQNNKSFSSSTRVYVAGESFVQWNNGNNDITNLVSDKQLLKIGDTQEYILQSPTNKGKALIIIEKDDGIIDYFVHNIKSYGDKISIPVKDNYYPNFYVKAILIGSIDNNPLPVYKRALSVTKVSTDYKKINITIKTDKTNYNPREKVNIQIITTDQDGKPIAWANGSIAVVDESLLALKGNPKQNPFAYFYDMKRYLGTLSYVSLKNIIEKLEIKDMTHGEKGGDGDNLKGGNSNKKRGIFKDTSYWLANFETDQNGVFNITTDELPDNLTTWVIEVFANTPSDNKIGVNRSSITTNKKIMINDNLPRFLRSGDEITIAPVIFNKSGKDQNIEVKLSSTNSIINDETQNIFIKNNEEKTVNFKLSIKEIGINDDKNSFANTINIKAKGIETNDSDEIEKQIPIKESSTPENISTIGSTDIASFDEKIDIGDIKNNGGILKINYSATILSSLFDSFNFLSDFPFGCIEQKTSAILPYIYLKSLYSGVGLNYDLNTKMIKYRDENESKYLEKSITQTINGYLLELPEFQLPNGGFVYWKEFVKIEKSIADFDLSIYILNSLGTLKNIGITIDSKITDKLVGYIKDRFNKNEYEGCSKNSRNNQCKYTNSQRLNAISALLNFNKDDYEGYKMRKTLNITGTNDYSRIIEAETLSYILQIKDLKQEEKNILENRAKELINKELSENIVYNPKGAYLGKGNYSRLYNTTKFIQTSSKIGLNKFNDIKPIIENMVRWILNQKQNNSFGSTQDNINVIKSMIEYSIASGELKNINFDSKLSLNNQFIDEKKIDQNNLFEVFSKSVDLKSLQTNNTFNISKNGNGKIYYDLNLSYYIPSKNIQARDEGISVSTLYFDYNEYTKIKILKDQEWQQYLSGFVKYTEMKYNKNIYEYLTPIKDGKIGQLVIVYNKIITPETRDKVAFEGYFPSGSELVNINLKTETKKGEELQNENDWLFSKKEFRNDRFFGYTDILDIGTYEYSYLIRLTHKGIFNITPSIIYEFYNPEIFGRTNGEQFIINQR